MIAYIQHKALCCCEQSHFKINSIEFGQKGAAANPGRIRSELVPDWMDSWRIEAIRWKTCKFLNSGNRCRQ